MSEKNLEYEIGDILYMINQITHKYEKFVYDGWVSYLSPPFPKNLPPMRSYYYKLVKDDIIHPIDYRALQKCLTQKEYRKLKLNRIICKTNTYN